MYYIKGLRICNKKNSKSYYIREILDSLSCEYKCSSLTFEEKYAIILELGLSRLTDILKKAFHVNNHPYDASHEADRTYKTLQEEVRGLE